MSELKNNCDLKLRTNVLKDLRNHGLLQDAHMVGLLEPATADNNKK